MPQASEPVRVRSHMYKLDLARARHPNWCCMRSLTFKPLHGFDREAYTVARSDLHASVS